MKFQLGNIKKLLSVSIHLIENRISIDGVLLKYTKGEIEVVEEVRRLSSVEELLKKFGAKQPIIIHFLGKGILNREVLNAENFHQAVLLNANPIDFYFTDYIQDKSAYSSVIRKDIVDGILEEFTQEKCQVISICCGPFVVMALAEFLNKDLLVTPTVHLNLEDNKIVEFKKGRPSGAVSYLIGSKRFDEHFISSVAHGVLFFNANEKISLPDNDIIFNSNREEAKQKVIFSQFGFFMMGFFLIMLLANYLYIGHLNKVNQINELMLADYNEEFIEITELEAEKTRKETLLRTSGVLSKKYISFYLSEISSSVPKAISFTQFSVKPLKKEIKTKHKIEIDNQRINVSGIAKTSRHLSNWIAELKTFDWIRKVEIEDYNYLEGKGEFTLKIVI